MIVLEKLARHALERGDDPALFGDVETLSWHALFERVTRMANWLDSLGVNTVAFQLDNGIDWIVTDLALALAGLNNVPVPTFFSSSQMQHTLRDSGAELFLCEAGGKPSQNCTAEAPPLSVGIEGWRIPEVDARVRSGHKITYTSGSTGQPKGVLLSSETLSAVTQSIVDGMAPINVARHLAVLPFATLLENVAGVYAPIVRGIEVHCPGPNVLGLVGTSMDFNRFAATVNRVQPHTMILVPQLLTAVVTMKQFGMIEADDFRFLAVGGGRISEHLLDAANRLGLPVYEGYGLSECASVLTLNVPGASRPGSVGRPLPHAEIRISEQGEIEAHGAMMDGYLGDAAEVREWYPTGDLGHIDDDGFVYIDGRIKNLYITSYGRNVNPEWVESSLGQCAAISQALVFGEARDHNLALLWLRFPQTADELGALIEAANAELPDYARAHEWLVIDTPFPPSLMTDNGRIKRAAALEHFGSLIDAHYAKGEENIGLLQAAD